MRAFDNPDWNLAQAVAWVRFRKREVVDLLSANARTNYSDLCLYPPEWLKGAKEFGGQNELLDALRMKRLVARGVRTRSAEGPEIIPADEWSYMSLTPPRAFSSLDGISRREVWTSILVNSADLKRLWRSELEIEGRSKYPWPEVRKLYFELIRTNPEISQNELIEELQEEVSEKLKRKPPSRSSIQTKIKRWRSETPASDRPASDRPITG